MTRAELRDIGAQMLGFPSYASAGPEQGWIDRTVIRAVYRCFQPEDGSRQRWAEENFGIEFPAPKWIDVSVTQGSRQFSIHVPEAMVVEGAGTTAVNGVYLRDGDNGGKPKYVIVGGDPSEPIDTIAWSSSVAFWVIAEELYASAEDVATPDLVQQWTVESLATAPAPTVRQAKESDFSKLAPLPDSAVYRGSYVLIDQDFYTYADNTDAANGEFVEPWEGGSGVVSAQFFHNSSVIDERVFAVRQAPELVGWGRLQELSGKPQEAQFRAVVYNDYWPMDGVYFYNSNRVRHGANSRFLIGTPAFYFIDDSMVGGTFARRFLVHPLPEERFSVRFRGTVGPAIPASGEVPFPGPSDFAEVVLVPVLEKLCSTSKRYAGKNQREIAEEYAAALTMLRSFSQAQKRRPTKARPKTGW